MSLTYFPLGAYWGLNEESGQIEVILDDQLVSFEPRYQGLLENVMQSWGRAGSISDYLAQHQDTYPGITLDSLIEAGLIVCGEEGDEFNILADCRIQPFCAPELYEGGPTVELLPIDSPGRTFPFSKPGRPLRVRAHTFEIFSEAANTSFGEALAKHGRGKEPHTIFSGLWLALMQGILTLQPSN